jgi:hypothetical protein
MSFWISECAPYIIRLVLPMNGGEASFDRSAGAPGRAPFGLCFSRNRVTLKSTMRTTAGRRSRAAV